MHRPVFRDVCRDVCRGFREGGQSALHFFCFEDLFFSKRCCRIRIREAYYAWFRLVGNAFRGGALPVQGRADGERLRSVIVIMRHGDRRPKEKLKFKSSNPGFLRYFDDAGEDNNDEARPAGISSCLYCIARGPYASIGKSEKKRTAEYQKREDKKSRSPNHHERSRGNQLRHDHYSR